MIGSVMKKLCQAQLQVLDKSVGKVVVGYRRSWTAVCPVENEVKTLVTFGFGLRAA